MDKAVTLGEPIRLVPTSLNEVIKYAEIMARSALVPKSYQGRPNDIVVAIVWGLELGVSPVQSLQNIAVVNGKATLWGDIMLAIVSRHHDFESHEEKVEGTGDAMAAICRIKRKGHAWHEHVFDVAKAKKAQLWNKQTYQQYPDIMLLNRARGFALRHKFPECFCGLITREEAEDYPTDKNMKVVEEVIEEVVDIKEETEKNAITDLPCWDDGETNSHLSIAAELIEKYSIPQKTVDNWCEKANINSLVEADDELLIKFIEGIKKKYE